MNRLIHRRALLRGAAVASGAFAAQRWLPAWAQSPSNGLAPALPTVSGDDITLRIARQTITIDGRVTRAIGVNGTVPAPLIRLREGQLARLRVVNDLEEDSSIHWHGLLLPAAMDGVPGVSFPGIKPRTTFVYEFPVRQNGTYWYHSHSGLQEQLGHYGPIVIDPAGRDPVTADREHVIVLSDHSAMSPTPSSASSSSSRATSTTRSKRWPGSSPARTSRSTSARTGPACTWTPPTSPMSRRRPTAIS